MYDITKFKSFKVHYFMPYTHRNSEMQNIYR